jgi:hypothetical protein
LVAQVGSEWPPAMAGSEAVVARPPRLGLQRNASEARPSCVRGSSSGC